MTHRDQPSGEARRRLSGEHEPLRPVSTKGPLAWMANNAVAANLLMLFFLAGGLVMAGRVKQEVFPEFDLELITVTAVYPGASPGEVEQGVVLALEEAVRGLDDIKRVSARASEGLATVSLELLRGADADQVLSNVRSAVDRITSLPELVERPAVRLSNTRFEVVSLVIYGDLSEGALRELANRARDDLLLDDRITLVDIDGVRPLEISIEVPQRNLRRYGLTLEQIAGAVSRASIELPGGGIDTEAGEVLVRTTERRDTGSDYRAITVLSQPDGTRVTIADLGRVTDGFSDVDQEAFFNGQRAVRVNLYRVGDQTPIEVSEALYEYIEVQRGRLPEGVSLAVWNDSSELYRDRISLLLRNGYIGLTLVLLILGLFLELRLAFWVTLGIPISFLGAVVLMPSMDVSLNMVSLFAFIVMLGVVVDDAIVVGESIYHKRQLGYRRLQAAIAGVREVAAPVVFAVLTTMMAFLPLFFVPGELGKFFKVIPAVVIAVLVLSLVESLLILPAHLAHSRRPSSRGLFGLVHRAQDAFARGFERFSVRIFRPSLDWAVRFRYLTLSIGLATVMLALSAVLSGNLPFVFWPTIETDVVIAELRMPFGTPIEETGRHVQMLSESCLEVFEELGGEARYSRGVFAWAGSGGSHSAVVAVFLVGSAERDFTAAELTRRWRERVAEIPGVERLSFDFAMQGGGAPIHVELSHSDVEVLEGAASRLAESLEGYTGVIDIDDGFSLGKEQLDVRLLPEARALGITAVGLARELRAAFFGVEAVRQQRGRDELRVYVRLPEEERSSEHYLDELVVRTPQGGEIPFRQAAIVERGRSYTQIQRRDGRRVMDVTAAVDEAVTNANQVVTSLVAHELPRLQEATPGLSWSLAGSQESQRETLGALLVGSIFALMAMYGLMAVGLGAYLTPAVIMSAIPFGVVGVVVGHLLMGYELSLISAMGTVALTGVVVNDSIILVAAVNQFRDEGMALREALVAGGVRRLRPILLTSLTTFFGLFPMILETSMQARFLIPMAVALGFGVLFATFITLVIVPANYAIVEDIKRAVGWLIGGLRRLLGWRGPEGG